MNRTKIINMLIEKFGYKSYLEIGIWNGKNFRSISCENKVGVDPNCGIEGILKMTSDEFFKMNDELGREKRGFDIIFIDGLHHAEQVYDDITNAMGCINDDGLIVVHDCNPTSEEMQIIPKAEDCKLWTGDVWKAWVKVRTKLDCETFVVDKDYGVGIINPFKEQKALKIRANLTYTNLEKYREKWLNLISGKDFVEWLRNK